MTRKITQSEYAARMEHLAKKCHRAHLPLTAPRRAIFAELAGRTDHPTAQQIWDTLRQAHPTLSLATVYKNLETFEKLKLAHKVILTPGVTRWDADMNPHHHAVHVETHEIRDIHEDINIPLPPSLKRRTLTHVSATFYIQ